MPIWLAPWMIRAAVLAVVFGVGWYMGHAGPAAELAAFKAKTKSAAEVQIAKNTSTEVVGADISKSSEREYENAIDALRSKPESRRVLQPGSRRCTPAQVSRAPAEANARPADVGLSAGSATTDRDASEDLAKRCQVTTVQYLFLRDWIEHQAEAWRRTQSIAPGNPANTSP